MFEIFKSVFLQTAAKPTITVHKFEARISMVSKRNGSTSQYGRDLSTSFEHMKAQKYILVHRLETGGISVHYFVSLKTKYIIQTL